MAIAVFSAGAPVAGNGLTTEDQLNDLVLAERAFALALTDVADLFDSPIVYMTDGTGSSSLVQRHRQLLLGWGVSMDATAAEDTDVSASTVTAYDADVTIARRALRYDQTGLARAVGAAWGFDPIQLGMTLADSFRAGRMGLLATAAAAAATNITSAGMGSVDDILDCIDSFTDDVGDPGQLFGLLRPKTAQSIRDSLRSEVGPLAARGDVQAFLAKGAENLMGVLCFQSTKVISSGGYYQNAIMTAGAIAYSIAKPQAPIGGNGIIMSPTDMPLLIEIERDASKDSYQIVGNGYDGVAIREERRIRGLLGATS